MNYPFINNKLIIITENVIIGEIRIEDYCRK